MQNPVIVCLDLEGVLVPEIWVNFAIKTGIEELKITTREMPDYDALMTRLSILDQHGLTLADIQSVIDAMGPMEGAAEFIAWLRERTQVIILSDTFYEFALPLMRQLGYPTIFCNQLEIGPTGRIVNYKLRQPHAGFFFRPPDHLPKEFPQFPVTKTYAELQEQFRKAGNLRE